MPAEAMPEDKIRKPIVRVRGRGRMMVEMKLGEAVMAKIAGTSLDSAEELECLVILNRGVPKGELTPTVAKLIAEAVAGKTVSAQAATRKRSPVALDEAWTKRMAFAWVAASHADKMRLVNRLMDEMKAIIADKEEE